LRSDPSETQRLSAGTSEEERRDVLAQIFTTQREKLRRMVEIRLHPRLRPRLDPSDVLQEAYVEACKRLGRYLRSPGLPVFLWLRRVTAYTLRDIHRRHLGAKARNPGREVARLDHREPEASSVSMADQLVARASTPSDAAQREERKKVVQKALDSLDPLDREILAIRFFEQLSSAEAAVVLGITEAAARKRYLRALARFKEAYGGPFETEG
jgi:RNA polymerase sigma-70 factor (ECF subfamily)